MGFWQEDVQTWYARCKQRAACAAEEYVAQRLRERGVWVLAQNYRRTGTELDIIGLVEKTLLIVEVKQRNCPEPLAALLPPHKQKALLRGARAFCSENLPIWETLRFDLAVVFPVGPPRGSWRVEYYPAIFSEATGLIETQPKEA